ncbi:hypothetical protein E7939_21840 [Salmonella enterica]|nr:hypothetical protein [Salmonella enterica]EAT8036366.1 hypothetical protein [Salmonella enterica]EAV6370514.1 hypothetical protein [Salmonella enterica]
MNRIVTEIPPSTTREYEVVHMASNTGRAQIRASGREPWIWYVGWPTLRLFEIDAKAALISPYYPESIGATRETTIGQLAQMVCAQHVERVIANNTSAADLADPNHPDLFRKDPTQ